MILWGPGFSEGLILQNKIARGQYSWIKAKSPLNPVEEKEICFSTEKNVRIPNKSYSIVIWNFFLNRWEVEVGKCLHSNWSHHASGRYVHSVNGILYECTQHNLTFSNEQLKLFTIPLRKLVCKFIYGIQIATSYQNLLLMGSFIWRTDDE